MRHWGEWRLGLRLDLAHQLYKDARSQQFRNGFVRGSAEGFRQYGGYNNNGDYRRSKNVVIGLVALSAKDTWLKKPSTVVFIRTFHLLISRDFLC
jgi:hypothetical protein